MQAYTASASQSSSGAEAGSGAIWQQLQTIFEQMDEDESEVDEALVEPLDHLRRLLQMHKQTQRAEQAVQRDRKQLESVRLERQTKLDAIASLADHHRENDSSLAHALWRSLYSTSLQDDTGVSTSTSIERVNKQVNENTGVLQQSMLVEHDDDDSSVAASPQPQRHVNTGESTTSSPNAPSDRLSR